MPRINTILQCFVDLNLEIDENSFFSEKVTRASFDQLSYMVQEGGFVDVKVVLDKKVIGSVSLDLQLFLGENVLPSDFNSTVNFPTTLTFTPTQTVKTIRISVPNDLLEEGQEKIVLSIVKFVDAKPGPIINAIIAIEDGTNLKTIDISTDGSDTSNSETVNFSEIEGQRQDIFVSLDSPSESGVERVDVVFKNNTADDSDYSSVGSTTLSWAIGEKEKIITIEANSDNEAESNETLSIFLENAQFAKLSEFSPTKALFTIVNDPPESRFTQINFQGLYVQRIGTDEGAENIDMRYWDQPEQLVDVANVLNTSALGGINLKFGSPIEIDLSSEQVCGSNCIPKSAIGFSSSDTIFFGENPSTGEFGDLRLKITNKGTHPSFLNLSTLQLNVNNPTSITNPEKLDVGESMLINVTDFDFSLQLPSNDKEELGVLTKSTYEFEFEVDYSEFGFQARNIDNTPSTTKSVNLGVKTFEAFSSDLAELESNVYNLTSSYKKAFSFYGETGPSSGKSCLVSGDNFPSNKMDIPDVKINGLIFLNSFDNPVSTDVTDYIDVDFEKGTSVDVTCIEVTVDENRIPAPSINGPFWTTIPIEVLE